MAGSYIADRPEKPALVEGDAILIGDSTVTGAGSGKKHLPKQSAKASSVALRTTGGQLKAADGIDNDDVVTMQQKAAESSKVVKLSRSLVANPDSADASLLADFGRKGYGVGDDEGLNKAVSFAELFTFTRASDKTSIGNPSGLIVTVPANEPAFEFDPLTGDSLGISTNEQRTNIIMHSTNMLNWSDPAARVTIVNTLINSPIKKGDGSQVTFQRVTPTTESNTHFVQRNNVSSSGLNTVSVIVKADGYNIVRLRAFSAEEGTIRTTFNLATQTISDDTADRSGIIDLGDGVYRIWHSVNYFINSGYRLDILNDSGGASFAGDGVKSILVAHTQIEAGRYVSPVILTESTQLTRLADSIYRVLGSEPNPNEGTVVIEFSGRRFSETGASFALRIGSDVNNYIGLGYNSALNYTASNYYVVDGVITILNTLLPLTNGRHRMAASWKLGVGFSVSLDGADAVSVAATTAAWGSVPTHLSLCTFSSTGLARGSQITKTVWLSNRYSSPEKLKELATPL